MDVIQVEGKPRKETGGASSRRLRAQGRIPAVLYGNKQETISIDIDAKKFEHDLQQLRGENVMIDLTIQGGKEKSRVFLREIHRDPVTSDLLHLDLLRIDENQKMHFSVPVHPVGTCAGVKMGGILDQHLRTVELKCLVKDLPSHIDAYVTDLVIHQSLHVSDLKVPESIEMLNPPKDIVFNVLPPRKIEVEEEVAPAEEEEKEPEVIGEKKEEKREEEKKEEKK